MSAWRHGWRIRGRSATAEMDVRLRCRCCLRGGEEIGWLDRCLERADGEDGLCEMCRAFHDADNIAPDDLGRLGLAIAHHPDTPWLFVHDLLPFGSDYDTPQWTGAS